MLSHLSKMTLHPLQGLTIQELIIWEKSGLLNSKFEQTLTEVLFPALTVAYEMSFGKILYLSVLHFIYKNNLICKMF